MVLQSKYSNFVYGKLVEHWCVLKFERKKQTLFICYKMSHHFVELAKPHRRRHRRIFVERHVHGVHTSVWVLQLVAIMTWLVLSGRNQLWNEFYWTIWWPYVITQKPISQYERNAEKKRLLSGTAIVNNKPTISIKMAYAQTLTWSTHTHTHTESRQTTKRFHKERRREKKLQIGIALFGVHGKFKSNTSQLNMDGWSFLQSQHHIKFNSFVELIGFGRDLSEIYGADTNQPNRRTESKSIFCLHCFIV